MLVASFLSLPPLVAVTTAEWSPNIALVMILCNLVAFGIGRFAIKNPGQGPGLPGGGPAILSQFGLPELLATASFGHLLGAGVILGLASSGAL